MARADDEVYLRGQSSLRVGSEARPLLYRTAGGGLGAMALAFSWVKRHAMHDSRCRGCGEIVRDPPGLHAFEDTLAATDRPMAFRLVTPARRCESCGVHGLAKREEAQLLFEDLVLSCEFPSGSTHVGADAAAEARRAQIWRVDPAEAERMVAPWLGRNERGRRRYYAPAVGCRDCYECGGDGACSLCDGLSPRGCIECHSTGRCILCRGSGQIPVDDAAPD